jgi:hypothetical protein
MTGWRPVIKLDDLQSIEDRLSRDRKLITAYIPGKGICYKVVPVKSFPHKRKRYKEVW